MKEQIPLTFAGKLTVFSLVIAAAGLVIRMISGVVFQTRIPPGLFILLIPAALVAFARWRWIPIIAVIAGLFIFVSYFPSGAAVRLLDRTRFGEFVGLWLQFLASFIAVIAGTAATLLELPNRAKGKVLQVRRTIVRMTQSLILTRGIAIRVRRNAIRAMRKPIRSFGL